jgi:glycolate oxidase iron-sulfur subunit
MQTNFTPKQLADPTVASSEAVIRKCVHCGFCTATCPTYTLLGDELDSPRGRIYLMKDMLENERVPTVEVVKHIDRCLSCLSCMTTCPSGVNYMHLVDHARSYIEQRYRRPFMDRFFRNLLAGLLPYSGRLRLALRLAMLARPLRPLVERIAVLRPLATMLKMAPASLSPRPESRFSAAPVRRGRVALLQGCAEPVLKPTIRASATRLLNRIGFDVAFVRGEVCCGALVHHMGREAAGLEAARRNVDAWMREIESDGLDAIVITASGCGTMIKDYGFLLRDDPVYAAKAARVSALAEDISEVLGRLSLPAGNGRGLVIAYHAACSLQHGQKVTELPKRLLVEAGYMVRTPSEAHMCCGSAGTYNLLQPAIADRLGDRKVAHIERLKPDVIATGNIGCAMQIGQRASVPVVHTVELLDWALGGPAPEPLSHLPEATMGHAPDHTQTGP